MATIYQIRSLTGLRAYVGHTRGAPRRRRNQHYRVLRLGTHHSRFLQRAWDKYGESDFVFEIIEECDDQAAVIREQHWIDRFSPTYNVAPAIPNYTPIKRTDETRLRISAAVRLVNENEEVIKRRRESARIASQRPEVIESRAAAAAARRGKKLTPEHRSKVIVTLGYEHTPENRQKLREARNADPRWRASWGHKKSESEIAAQRERFAEQKRDPEFLEACRVARKKRHDFDREIDAIFHPATKQADTLKIRNAHDRQLWLLLGEGTVLPAQRWRNRPQK